MKKLLIAGLTILLTAGTASDAGLGGKQLKVGLSILSIRDIA